MTLVAVTLIFDTVCTPQPFYTILEDFGQESGDVVIVFVRRGVITVIDLDEFLFIPFIQNSLRERDSPW